ncbi:hypothetical protein BON22_3307 [Cyberlindnera fabianii]|uniref:Uncharacterized protein n=1 Tax=Cyberlindnera fabianii TaxID=36022 RepID=A0A1V2L492_CYBFA|nr:hypothetical protein BON22_3307 [Cyberlindnera fabianii]
MFDILAAIALIKRKNACGAPSLRFYLHGLAHPEYKPLEIQERFPHTDANESALLDQINTLTQDERDQWTIRLCLAGVSPSRLELLFGDASTLICKVLRGYIEINELDKRTVHAYNERDAAKKFEESYKDLATQWKAFIHQIMFASHQSTITFLIVFIGNYRSFIHAQLITLLSTMRIPEFPGCGAAKKKEYSNFPGSSRPFGSIHGKAPMEKVTDPASPGFLFFSSTLPLELLTSYYTCYYRLQTLLTHRKSIPDLSSQYN